MPGGQLHGGTAQGIGNAWFEQLVYDERGHIRNANLRDYLLPIALDVPRIETGHETTPSRLNPLGIKGTGEAGAIPVGPLFAQALEAALFDRDFEILEIPLSAPAACGRPSAGPRQNGWLADKEPKS
jgi:CO/xanthine dehydrogenase Mo-binding subunit